jgi:hypothetical protein
MPVRLTRLVKDQEIEGEEFKSGNKILFRCIEDRANKTLRMIFGNKEIQYISY